MIITKKDKKLTDLTLEELQERYKKSKGSAIGISIVMVIAVIALIYLSLETKNYALIAVAISCSITLLPMFMSLNQIATEIKSRNSK